MAAFADFTCFRCPVEPRTLLTHIQALKRGTGLFVVVLFPENRESGAGDEI